MMIDRVAFGSAAAVYTIPMVIYADEPLWMINFYLSTMRTFNTPPKNSRLTVFNFKLCMTWYDRFIEMLCIRGLV